MTIDNVNAVGARGTDAPKLTPQENNTKINCVFTEGKSETKEAATEKEAKSEVIYLKNSTYKEFLIRSGRNDALQYDPFTAMGYKVQHWLERGRENRDFKKIESGELDGKTVFINKKEYKAYIKEHPEEKGNAVLMKSGKGREFVRDNAEKLGLDVRGEYKTAAEKSEERKEAIKDLKEARKEYKQAKAAAKAEYKAKLKEFEGNN